MSRRRAAGRRPWRQRWRHSLRARLITVFLLLAFLMSGVFMFGTQRALSVGWRDAARPLVTDYLDRLVGELGSPPDPAKARALVARLPITIAISGPQVNWTSRPDERHSWRDGGLKPRGELLTRHTADGHLVRFGVARPDWQSGPDDIGLFTLLTLLVLLTIVYAYVRRLLRPLDDIRAGADRFGRGQFDQPIPLRRRDELGDLAHRINTMARDIEGMLDAKRTLLLALSHELRSPLTRARLNAELLQGNDESTPEHRALLRDLGLMRDLIGDLIESERLASPHAALHREPVDVAALIREAVADLPGAVDLDLAAVEPLTLDRTRVRLLVRNLADNALRHGGEAPVPPLVSLRADAKGSVVIAVRDHGPGVEEDKLPHIAEPFYRTDAARQRATGGVGLGLYLCRLIAEAHGGGLTASNAHPGLRIEATLR